MKIFNKKQYGVIYVDRNCLYFYEKSWDKVLKLNLTPDLMKDLEIIDKTKLESAVKNLLTSNQLFANQLILVLSEDLYFEKDIPADTQNYEEALENFLNKIPYENILYRQYKTEKTEKVVVINKTFYETVRSAFEKEGFIIDCTVPSFILDIKINPKTGPDLATAIFIAEKAVSLRTESLTPTIQQVNSEYLAKQERENKYKDILVTVVVVVFFIVMAALWVAFYFSNQSKKTIAEEPPIKSVRTTPTPKVFTVSPSLESTGSATISGILKVQLLNGTGITGQPENFKVQLLKKGLTDVTISTSEFTNAGKTIVVFSQKLTTEIKNRTLLLLETVFGSVTTQETTDQTFDVTIITGKGQ